LHSVGSDNSSQPANSHQQHPYGAAATYSSNNNCNMPHATIMKGPETGQRQQQQQQISSSSSRSRFKCLALQQQQQHHPAAASGLAAAATTSASSSSNSNWPAAATAT